MQQSVIQGDQDKILQHEDEVDTGAKVVSVQMLKSVVEGDKEKILLRGVQGDGKRMSGDGLDGVQCVQGQRKGSVLKGCDQDHCGVQGVQCHVLNKVIQISDLDYMWRSMIDHDDEVKGDQIEMHESIQGVNDKLKRSRYTFKITFCLKLDFNCLALTSTQTHTIIFVGGKCY